MGARGRVVRRARTVLITGERLVSGIGAGTPSSLGLIFVARIMRGLGFGFNILKQPSIILLPVLPNVPITPFSYQTLYKMGMEPRVSGPTRCSVYAL